MFRLIEGRLKKDDAAFLKLCKENVGELSDVGRNLLIMNITRLIQTEDQVILREMAEFVRANLSMLPPAIISFAGRMLDGIEEKISGLDRGYKINSVGKVSSVSLLTLFILHYFFYIV